MRGPFLRVLLVCLRGQLLLIISVSFLVTEGIDPFPALSAYLLVLEWQFWVDSVNRNRLLLKGLRLAVTSDVPVILHYTARNILFPGLKQTLPSMCDFCSGDLHQVCWRLSWPLLVKDRSSHIGLIRIYSPFLDIINRTFHFSRAKNASFCHPGNACNK